MPQQVQWGSIVLLLEHEEFSQAFREGRQYYFEDINGEQPQRAVRMTSEDVLRQIMGCDEHGRFHFDEEVTGLPVTYLGILLGYMHGPRASGDAGGTVRARASTSQQSYR